MDKTNNPDPHVQLSFINRDLSWPQVIAELVDNAFDEAAGNSPDVTIELHRDKVSVRDSGRGVDDINRLSTLGSSASYHREGNIGQYGIGAKGWMCRAEKLDVETVRDGVRHRHTFSVSHVYLAAKKKKPITHFLRAYTGPGSKTNARSFTQLTMRELTRGPVIIPALVSELQKMYWPGLLGGKKITIKDFRRCVLWHLRRLLVSQHLRRKESVHQKFAAEGTRSGRTFG